MPTTPTDLSSRLAAVLNETVAAGRLVGVSAVLTDADRTLAAASAGFADREAGRPFDLSDVCWVASQTKPVTAVAVMMLVDAGLIDLDAPVERYVPRFKGFWVARETTPERRVLTPCRTPITVRAVLCHMAGLPFLSATEAVAIDRVPLAALVDGYPDTPLLHEPWTVYRYTNMGTNTAGRVIEAVAGVPYETFLSDRVFGPLGMTDTAFVPDAARVPTAYGPAADGLGYAARRFGFLSYPLDGPNRFAAPGGGLFSTQGDMARFGRLMLGRGVFEGRRLFSEAAYAEMTCRQTPPHVAENSGLCWGLRDGRFSHGGAGHTHIEIDPARGRAVSVMTQVTAWPAGLETTKDDLVATLLAL